MIEISNLTKKIDGKIILDDVSLSIKKGSIYGIIGVNGAGKTTLINHLVGSYRPTSGSVKIDGEDIYDNASMKQKVIYIPDEFVNEFGKTGNEIVKLFSKIYPTFSMERYLLLMKKFNRLGNENISKYSKGMKKQLLFILALSIMPEYLIMDEPFDGLDPQIKKVIWDILIEDVSTRKMTLFISSHHMQELDTMCDHITLINNGKVIFENSIDTLKDKFIKVQLVLPDTSNYQELYQRLSITNHQEVGRIHTIIIKESKKNVQKIIEEYQPIIEEYLPLSLEEIFLYTLGGIDDEFKKLFI